MAKQRKQQEMIVNQKARLASVNVSDFLRKKKKTS